MCHILGIMTDFNENHSVIATIYTFESTKLSKQLCISLIQYLHKIQ